MTFDLNKIALPKLIQELDDGKDFFFFFQKDNCFLFQLNE